MAKLTLADVLIASSGAAYDISSILPETDLVLELQNLLIFQHGLISAIVERRTDMDPDFLMQFHEKCKQLTEAVAIYKNITLNEWINDG